jgi:hypothetical protein
MPILGARGGASSRGLGQFQGNPTAPTSPVAGYHLWLDAANAGSFTYSSGTIVSQWTDRSANAFTFTTPLGTANQPSRSGTQNSKSTVVFDGSNDYLKSTAANSTWKYLHDGTGATIFVVAKSNEAVPGDYDSRNGILTTREGDVGFSVNYETGYTPTKIKFEIGDANVSSFFYNETNTVGTGYAVYAALLDPNNGINNDKLPLYVNGGVKLNPYLSNWSGASTANPDVTLHLGTGYPYLIGNPGYTLAGEIAEIITYKSLLSDSDRIANTNYLRAKWGI